MKPLPKNFQSNVTLEYYTIPIKQIDSVSLGTYYQPDVTKTRIFADSFKSQEPNITQQSAETISKESYQQQNLSRISSQIQSPRKFTEIFGKSKKSLQSTSLPPLNLSKQGNASFIQKFAEQNQEKLVIQNNRNLPKKKTALYNSIQHDYDHQNLDVAFDQHFQQNPDIVTLNKMSTQKLLIQPSTQQLKQSDSILRSQHAQKLINKVLSHKSFTKRYKTQQKHYETIQEPERDSLVMHLYSNIKKEIKKKMDQDNYESFSDKTDEYQDEEVKDEKLEYEFDHEEQIKFFKKSMMEQKAGLVNLQQIIKTQCNQRTSEQRQHLAAYLQFKVPFFLKFKRSLIDRICERLEHKELNAGEVFIKQGEIGDCMYIVFKGQVQIFQIRDGQHNLLAVVNHKEVVGENAIKSLDEVKRGAGVITTKPSLLLVLHKTHYHEVLQYFLTQQRIGQLKWLESLKIFEQLNIPKVKVIDLNLVLQEQKFPIKAVIYNIESAANTAYIVREGRLVMHTVIEVDDYFKVPKNSKEWDVRKTTKRIEYKIRELNRGDFFGHEEIFQNMNRKSFVTALTHCSLVYINKDVLFGQQMPQQLLEHLKQNMVIFDSEKIAQQIQSQIKNKKTRSKALLDATKISNYDFGGFRGLDLIQHGSKLKKLSKWLDQSRKNKATLLPLLHQLHKVKLLDTINHAPVTLKIGQEIKQDEKTRFVVTEDVNQTSKQNSELLQQMSQKFEDLDLDC